MCELLLLYIYMCKKIIYISIYQLINSKTGAKKNQENVLRISKCALQAGKIFQIP